MKLRTCMVLLCVALLATSAFGASITWKTSVGKTGNWNVSTNWTQGSIPTAVDDVTFSGINTNGNDVNPNITMGLADQYVNSLTLNPTFSRDSNNTPHWTLGTSAGNLTLTTGNLNYTQSAGQGYTQIGANVILGNNATWAINALGASGGDVDSITATQAYTFGDLVVTGSLTSSGGPFSLTKTGNAILQLQNAADPGISSLTVTGGVVRRIAAASATTTNLGAGPVTLNGGGVEYNFYSNTGSGTPTVTNDFLVGASGGRLVAAYKTYSGVAFSGTIGLGGALQIGSWNVGANSLGTGAITYSGTVTVDQSSTGLRALWGMAAGDFRNSAYTGNGQAVLSGVIQDGAGTAANPLFLKAGGRQNFNITSASTYTEPTIIDSCIGNWNSSFVSLSTATAKLGSGNITIRPAGMLNLTATTNFNGAQTISVQSSNMAIATLGLGMTGTDALTALGHLTSDSSGIISFANVATGKTLDESLYGNGKMFFGGFGSAWNGETTIGTILPGSDGVWRFGGSAFHLNQSFNETGTSGTRSMIVGANKVGGATFLEMYNTYANSNFTGGTIINPGSTLSTWTDSGKRPIGTGTIQLKGAALNAYVGGIFGPVIVSGASAFGNTWGSAILSCDSLSRATYGTMSINGSAVTGLTGTSANRFVVNDNNVNVVNGMTDPWLSMVTDGNNSNANFVTYAPTSGFSTGAIVYTDITSDANLAAAGSTAIARIGGLTINTGTTGTPKDIWALKTANASAGNCTVNINDGLNIGSGGLFSDRATTINGPGTLTFGTIATPVVAYVNNGLYTQSAGGNMVINAPIVAAGLVKFGGPTTLVLTNTANSFSGPVVVNSGYLMLQGLNSDPDKVMGASSTDLILNGGTALINSTTAGPLSSFQSAGNATFTHNIQVTEVNGTFAAYTQSPWPGNMYMASPLYAGNVSSVNFTGNISGAGILTLDGFAGGSYGFNATFSGTNNTLAGGLLLKGAVALTIAPASSVGNCDVQIETGASLTLQGTNNVPDASTVTVSLGGVVNVQAPQARVLGLEGLGNVAIGGAGGAAAEIVVGGGTTKTFYGQFQNAGTSKGSVRKTGTGTFNMGSANTATGTLTVENGTLNLTGSWAGNVSVASQDSVVNPSLNFLGGIGGNLNVAGGQVNLGTAPVVKTVGGLSFATSGTLASQIEIDTFSNSQTPGVGYDKLVVNGTANLANGQLLIKIAPTTNFIGDVMTILTSANDMTGQSISAKFVGGFGTLAISPDGHSVTLSKIAYAGDADQDGTVGGSDYTQWLNNFGVTGANWSQADLDGDGTVGGSDYAIWLNNFGVSQSDYGPAGVPEPATMCLLALGGAALLKRRRK